MQLPTLNPTILNKEDFDYPQSLKMLKGAPELLYVLGDVKLLNTACFSVIGSRLMTNYGQKVLNNFIPQLVKAGLTIVSGLAYGIDAAAHLATLKEQGKTLAVLGSGFAKIYPQANLKILSDIIGSGGCVITEFKPDTPAYASNFPRRNRIVAGISRGTLIVEAGQNSGTLITASFVQQYGKELFVIPGDIYKDQSQGINELLQNGWAKPVFKPSQILDELNFSYQLEIPLTLTPALTGSLGYLYDLILQGYQTLDPLIQRSSLSAAEVQSILSILELDGYITFKDQVWQKT